MPKFKVILTKSAMVTRWVEADSEEEIRKIFDGEDPDNREIDDIEYDWDEDGEEEEIERIILLKD